MLKQTFQVTLFSIFGIAINFATQLLLAYFFGATSDRDAYYAASTIPAYISTLFTGSFGVLLLPYLVKYQIDRSPDESDKFASAVLNVCFLALTGVVLLTVLAAAPLLELLIPKSRPVVLAKSIFLFRILAVSMLFTIMTNLLAAVFHVRRAFLVPAMAPVASGLIILIMVGLFSNQLGIAVVAYGTLGGALFSFAFMTFRAFTRFGYKWRPSIVKPEIRTFLLASFPLLLTGIIFRSTTVFERFFAARLPEGGLSYVGNGSQIIVILSTIISGGIATTSYPLLSKLWSDKALSALDKSFSRIITSIMLIVFPVIVVFLLCGRDIVKLMFERGAFTGNDTEALYRTLVAFMGYFLFSSLGSVVARLMYLSQKTWISSFIGMAELLVYVTAAMLLTRVYGYTGLAAAMSVGACFNVIVSIIFIRKKIVPINIVALLKTVIVLTLVCGLIFLGVYYVNKTLFDNLNSFGRIAVTGIGVFGLYWTALLLLGNNYYKMLTALIKRR